jgi:hypothetical protein
MLIEIALVIVTGSVMASCLLAGSLFTFNKELSKAQALLSSKVLEFDDITRKASIANNSIGDQVVILTKKIAEIEESMKFLQSMSRNK